MRPSIVFAIALLAVPLAANAADITVPIDQSRRLPIGGAASSIMVGNKNIADVRAIDTRTLMVVGKKQGVTNVVVFDAAGRTLFDGEIIVSAASGSMVTVYRGSKAEEYACSPYCQSNAAEADPIISMPMSPVITSSAPPPSAAPASPPGD